MVVICMIVLIVNVFMILLGMLMMIVLVIFRVRVVMFGVVVAIAFAGQVLHGFWRVFLAFFPVLSLIGLSGRRRIGARVVDDLALDALAIAAAA